MWRANASPWDKITAATLNLVIIMELIAIKPTQFCFPHPLHVETQLCRCTRTIHKQGPHTSQQPHQQMQLKV